MCQFLHPQHLTSKYDCNTVGDPHQSTVAVRDPALPAPLLHGTATLVRGECGQQDHSGTDFLIGSAQNALSSQHAAAFAGAPSLAAGKLSSWHCDRHSMGCRCQARAPSEGHNYIWPCGRNGGHPCGSQQAVPQAPAAGALSKIRPAWVPARARAPSCGAGPTAGENSWDA